MRRRRTINATRSSNRRDGHSPLHLKTREIGNTKRKNPTLQRSAESSHARYVGMVLISSDAWPLNTPDHSVAIAKVPAQVVLICHASLTHLLHSCRLLDVHFVPQESAFCMSTFRTEAEGGCCVCGCMCTCWGMLGHAGAVSTHSRVVCSHESISSLNPTEVKYRTCVICFRSRIRIQSSHSSLTTVVAGYENANTLF